MKKEILTPLEQNQAGTARLEVVKLTTNREFEKYPETNRFIHNYVVKRNGPLPERTSLSRKRMDYT